MSQLPKNWMEPDTDDPLTSIAISLKRIADNMERVEITGSEQTIDLSRMKAELRNDLLRMLNDAKARGLSR